MHLLKFLLINLLLLPSLVFAEPALQVDVNTADIEQIKQALSGIGDKKAQAIVNYRNENGLFKSPYDLMLVNGIGKKTVEKNLDRILLSQPQPTVDEPQTEGQDLLPAETVPQQQIIEPQIDAETQAILYQDNMEPDFSGAQLEVYTNQQYEKAYHVQD